MAESVVYRCGTEADFPELAPLYERLHAYYYEYGYSFPRVEQVSQLWLDSFRRTLGRFSMLHLALVDGKIAGFMLSRLKRVAPYMGGVLVGELSDLWVEPEARRLGIAEKLTRQAAAWMQSQGAYSVEAQLLYTNTPIQKLYDRMGFKRELVQVRLMFDDLKPE